MVDWDKVSHLLHIVDKSKDHPKLAALTNAALLELDAHANSATEELAKAKKATEDKAAAEAVEHEAAAKEVAEEPKPEPLMNKPVTDQEVKAASDQPTIVDRRI